MIIYAGYVLLTIYDNVFSKEIKLIIIDVIIINLINLFLAFGVSKKD